MRSSKSFSTACSGKGAEGERGSEAVWMAGEASQVHDDVGLSHRRHDDHVELETRVIEHLDRIPPSPFVSNFLSASSRFATVSSVASSSAFEKMF